MSNDYQSASCSMPTRSRLIMHRTMQAISASGLNILKFASRVAERYVGSVQPLERIVDFHESGSTVESAVRAELGNGKLVDRFIKGVVRFPVDLEEIWVDCLPEPNRSDLIRELAWRYGLIGAKLPAETAHEHMARLSDVLADAGRTAQLLAPMFGSGKLSLEGESGQRIKHSMVVIDRAIGNLVSLREQIESQQQPKPAAKPAKRRR